MLRTLPFYYSAIKRNPGCCIGDLAIFFNVTHQSVVTAIQRLKTLGAIREEIGGYNNIQKYLYIRKEFKPTW